MQINCIGNWFGCDGFSNHIRQLAIAMDKQEGLDISMTCNRPQGWESLVNDQELKIMLRDPEKADVNLMIGQPQYWRLFSNENKPFIGFLIWEGDKIPTYWIEYLLDKNVKQIWVPSQHVKEAIMNTFEESYRLNNIIPCGRPPEHEGMLNSAFEQIIEKINDKIKTVSHGVDLSIFKPTETKKEKFTFFCDKGWRSNMDRGGTQDTVKAYLEEFSEEDNVSLLIKINPAYPVGNIQQMIEELKPKDKTSFASIKLIADAVPFEKLNEIYNLGDVFVNSSKAEAFHLGCLQAMACGLPVISNDFGGQVDYINNENGWMLKEGIMKEVTHELEYEGVLWKDVNIEELKKVMRWCYENKENTVAHSQYALNTAKEWTWDKSAEKAHANLKTIS